LVVGSGVVWERPLAQFEMKIVLATILSHYNLELAESKPVQAKRRGVTLAPAGGIKMAFK